MGAGSSGVSTSQRYEARGSVRAGGNIRKFGTITNTLAASCELLGTIEAVAPGGAP
jgi:hypothetical protein